MKALIHILYQTDPKDAAVLAFVVVLVTLIGGWWFLRKLADILDEHNKL